MLVLSARAGGQVVRYSSVRPVRVLRRFDARVIAGTGHLCPVNEGYAYGLRGPTSDSLDALSVRRIDMGVRGAMRASSSTRYR